jgi:HlyD family type I secretion membrane fusion protein
MRLLRHRASPRDAALHLLDSYRSETGALLAEPGPLLTRSTLRMSAVGLVLAILLAAVTRVDRTVTAAGQINSRQPTIVVQSLDRAIITSLAVREGDRVKAGQELATLDATFAAADVAGLTVQVESLAAEIGRLEAERENREIVTGSLPVRYEAIQRSLLQRRRAERDEKLRGIDEKIAGGRATIQKYLADARQYGEQLRVVTAIEAMRRKLFDLGSGSQLTYLDAVHRRMEIERNVEYENNARVETEHALAAAQSERQSVLRQWQTQVDTDLAQRRAERDAALEQLAKATKHHELINLRAPADAIVQNMAKLSVGSVLTEAAPLFTLVPIDAPLEAEIRIDADDIGFVRPGDPVAIKLAPYTYLEHGYVEGHLRVLSADAVTTTEDRNAAPTRPYYKGYVTLDRVRLRDVPKDFKLLQGTPVTADIKVGQRTLLSYLLTGALRTVDGAMREP